MLPDAVFMFNYFLALYAFACLYYVRLVEKVKKNSFI